MDAIEARPTATGCHWTPHPRQERLQSLASPRAIASSIMADVAKGSSQTSSASPVQQVLLVARRLLTDRRWYWRLATLLLVGEVLICLGLIHFRPCKPSDSNSDTS